MPAAKKSTTRRLRDLSAGLPPGQVGKPIPPERLTSEQARENRFLYQERRDDPVYLVQRTLAGLIPMARVLVRSQTDFRFVERAMHDTARALGLKSLGFYVRGGRREVVLFQEQATLAHFYNPEDTIARFKTVGVVLDREAFDTPLEAYARPLVSGDFPPAIAQAMAALCQGRLVQDGMEDVVVQRMRQA